MSDIKTKEFLEIENLLQNQLTFTQGIKKYVNDLPLYIYSPNSKSLNIDEQNKNLINYIIKNDISNSMILLVKLTTIIKILLLQEDNYDNILSVLNILEIKEKIILNNEKIFHDESLQLKEFRDEYINLINIINNSEKLTNEELTTLSCILNNNLFLNHLNENNINFDNQLKR